MSQNVKYFDIRTSYDHNNEKKNNRAYNTIEPSVNNILATVHQRLKYNPKPSVPKIPKAIADTMPLRLPEVLLMESPNKQKIKQRKIFEKEHKTNSIHQLQADRELKSMTQARRFGTTSDMMTFQNQKRYRELLSQKRILEEMLKEHQKLQSDRDNIASEINYMRSYLDNIRNKLDVSLRKLNSQKTLVEIEPERKATAKPVKRICQRHVKGTRSAPGRARIAGGSDSHVTRSRISVLATPKNSSAHKTQSRLILKNRKPQQPKRGAKQWVYCSKVDRKDYVRSIFV